MTIYKAQRWGGGNVSGRVSERGTTGEKMRLLVVFETQGVKLEIWMLLPFEKR
ncbi:hypothetical protein JWG42_16620 [Desulfoprunum benzoelyticum]|uniref:Rhamnose utilization protein RhaD (Predicted bifunctional aldolase and dehydrogenase) n=1 Tax=Desulfoprunum benzoelyticum TaxID=1506996 RepID=A0A840US01_9BACT|nr:hypothetical protein [Desulfoprunum benzoelyticum]MBB5348997.1 rhamnose utilization protein RhaD (predicted bifunctional aldolase and dehydrogenase) [Desulfoprunum benzoelyticum]MBM9531784.1 hypothetical protein [Desulfoprunum benzoelyticum]